MNKVNSLVWRNMINEGIWMVGIGISRAGALENTIKGGKSKGEKQKTICTHFHKRETTTHPGGV